MIDSAPTSPPDPLTLGRGGDEPVDALLVVSFGGPEGPDDVLPFLENVTRGRGIPRERLVEVGAHYALFGGVSPINENNRTLVKALEHELATHGPRLPVYWGNRNWGPYLADTLQRMADDGIRHALAFLTSSVSSYSGCRQYREDIARAQAAVGERAPRVDRMRHYYNHPGFVTPMIERTRAALGRFEEGARGRTHLAFTAHSIPSTMNATSGPDGGAYASQLTETARLVAEAVGVPPERWRLVYQSRSGPPSIPWLEPDVGDHLEALHREQVREVVMVPIGFTSDHIEVLFDLDVQARQRAAALPGLRVERAATVGADPRFVTMVRELVVERMSGAAHRPSLGLHGPSHDVCPGTCCPAPARRPAAPAAG
jgi:ferrochelatase